MSAECDDVWDHFEKILDDESTERKAKCSICGNCYNYTATIHNLKSHLSTKHGIQVALRNPTLGGLPTKKNATKLKRNEIWNAFRRVNKLEKIAACKVCGRLLSYRSTTGNLLNHCKRLHPDVSEKLFSKQSLDFESDTEICEEEEQDEETSEGEGPSQPDENWTYFEREGSRARCAICRTHVAASSRALYDHLRSKHPKLLPDGDVDSDQGEDDNEHFTEVIYLEETPKSDEKARLKRKRMEYVEVNNRKRRSSPPPPPPPPPPPRPKEPRKNPEDVELESFGAYIICLLKSLPKDVCSAVQRDIINIIMNAKLQKPEESQTQVVIDGTPVIIKTMSQSDGKNILVLENEKQKEQVVQAEESKVQC